MLITRISPYSNKEQSMEIPISEEEYQAWQGGTPIHEAAPKISADQREFIISGLTAPEWRKMYGKGCCG